MKTTLTIEQSKRLIELGIDPGKASMSNSCAQPYKGARGIVQLPVSRPIFTLRDLLTILPKEIKVNGSRTSLQMFQHLAGYWIASYVVYDGNIIIHQRPLSADKELIDSLYSLLIWAIENHNLKPDKQ